jgi:hypothetical protein
MTTKTDDKQRAKYEDATERFRELAAQLGQLLGPVDAASVCLLAATEQLLGSIGRERTLEYLRAYASNVERTGTASLN